VPGASDDVPTLISHVEEDYNEAKPLMRALERLGYDVWIFERDALPAVDYVSQIVSAINACEAFILVISPHALSSVHVDKELVAAYKKDKVLIPVMKEISFAEFQARKPNWDHMLGRRMQRGFMVVIYERLPAGSRKVFKPLVYTRGEQPVV